MIRASGRALRALIAFALMVVVAGTVAVGALAWRLSQGPIAIDPLAQLLERHFNAEGRARVTIGGAALAWEGFGHGVDRPLDIRVSDVRLRDASGAEVVTLPQGEVSLGLRSLLLGQIEPRAISLTGLRLVLVRDSDGTILVDLGRSGEVLPPEAAQPEKQAAIFAELGLAPLGEGERPARWAELRRILVRQAEIVVEDRQLGIRWTVPDADLQLRRVPAGRGTAIAAEASGVATAGEARLPVVLRARIDPDGSAETSLVLDDVEPAALAAALPSLRVLSALEARASGTVTARREADGTISGGTLDARLGSGRVTLPGAKPVPLTGGHVTARYAPAGITIDELRLSLPAGRGPSPTVTASAHAVPDGAGGWIAEAGLRVDAVDAGDLPALWPETVGAGARNWIRENISAGTAEDLALTLQGAWPAGGVPSISHLEGTVRAKDVTVHYLRPMPPVEGVAGTLTLGLDEIGIQARGGRLGAIRVPEAGIRILDLRQPLERIEIRLRVEAPIAEAIRLLEHPRLDLLSRKPLPPGISGAGEASVSIGFPLLKALGFDRVSVSATARTEDGRVPDLLAGNAFERAQIELSVNEQGLRLGGSGSLGTVRADVRGEMDFRTGPPAQVVERFTARIPAQEGIPDLFGLDLAPFVTGPLSGEAVLETRRNGEGTATVRADLTQARVAVDDLGVVKPRGQPGRVEARLRLAAGRLTAAEVTRLEAGDIAGRARFAMTRDGRLERIEVAEARLGLSRLSGSVRLPQRPDEDYAISVRGPLFDLSHRDTVPQAEREARRREAPPPPRGRSEPASRGPRLAIDAAIDRVVIRPGHELASLSGTILHADGVTAQTDISARVGERGIVRMQIMPEGARRALKLTADDAGAALNAFNVITTMAGGTLSVRGLYDDVAPGRPLTGEAEILDFRMREAPAGARILQAMTLFGALELARGPGLSFNRAVAAFTLTDGKLELRDARAFGASLGFTAKGSIDRNTERIDLEGTIVPAYVFNSLLGHIPLIGRLFSPEQGGGVFAATYRVRGPLSDPEASVNPLAALTPGFLRGLFGLLEGGGQPGQPPGPDTPEHQRGG